MTDWDHRQLCSDGACVGLISDAGTCKVCGRAAANWGEERKRGLLEASAEAAALDEEDESDDDEDGEYEDDEDGEYDDDDDDDDEDADEDAEGDEDGAIAASAGSAGETGEWKGRTLCADGGCVGVIGPDGTCKACGKAGG